MFRGNPREKVRASVILAVGALCVLGSTVIIPAFGVESVTPPPGGGGEILIWRWLLLLAGWLLLPLGMLSIGLRDEIPEISGRRLTRVALAFTGGFLALALGNYVLFRAGINYGTVEYFPISVFRGPMVRWTSLPYGAAFLVLVLAAVRTRMRLGAWQVWLMGLALLVLGNLAQGGFREAFHVPLAGSGVQFFHEAIRVTDWQEWLRNFNEAQSLLSTHARTHPPFAVLLHHLLFSVGRQSIPILAGSLTLISSLTVPLVWRIMREVGATKVRASEFALLFALIPAFNIYAAVSLDGVVAALSTVCLLGIVMLVRRGMSLLGVALVVGGILLANTLTFGGTLLLVIAGVVAVSEIVTRRRFGMLVAVLATVAVGVFFCYVVLPRFGYDHPAASGTAWYLENRFGFSAFHAPAVYALTRVEGVVEIALFLSVGVLSVLFIPSVLRLRVIDLRDDVTRVFLGAIVVIGAAFAAGMFRTGETARICLFLLPYFLLVLRKLPGPVVRALALSAGLQTMLMQTFGAYFW